MRKISIWYRNLNSIETYLKISSNLATSSILLKDYVTNLLLGEIKTFVGEVEDFSRTNDFVHSLLVVKRSSIYTIY